jgi:hypothetical protein
MRCVFVRLAGVRMRTVPYPGQFVLIVLIPLPPTHTHAQVRVSCSPAAVAARRATTDPVAAPAGSPPRLPVLALAAMARVSWPWSRMGSMHDGSAAASASASASASRHGSASMDGTVAGAADAAAACIAAEIKQQQLRQQLQQQHNPKGGKHKRTKSAGTVLVPAGTELRPSDHASNSKSAGGSDPSKHAGSEHSRFRINLGSGSKGSRTNARTLVDGLLAHVEVQTADARAWAEARNAAAEAKRRAKEQVCP